MTPLTGGLTASDRATGRRLPVGERQDETDTVEVRCRQPSFGVPTRPVAQRHQDRRTTELTQQNRERPTPSLGLLPGVRARLVRPGHVRIVVQS
ncbi:hypothetical protein, partial [Streptomyces echinatus]|uniref:hypothetical protein n=1 Tax=Streptomyces echinatus TaxID=67293 RepID=UPI001CED48CE